MSWARFFRGSLRADRILPSAAPRILRFILPRHHLHGHQSRDEYCQVELSRQGFADGKRACDGSHCRDVSVANRGEGHEAVVNPVADVGHLSDFQTERSVVRYFESAPQIEAPERAVKLP